MNMRSSVLLSCALLGCSSGCSESEPGIAVSIAGQFSRTNGATVDLVEANPQAWDRVCVLGPYSDNAAARKALGFEWDAETHSAIKSNDGIALLVFAQGRQVTTIVEHPRNLGDFAPLSGQCFPRARARFYQASQPPGPPGLRAKSG